MNLSRLFRAGLMLGVGLGGFFDGIVFHQILGWHHLVCTTDTCQPDTIAALQRQNTQDGFFHLASWLVTIAGVNQLFHARLAARDQPGSGRVLVGGALTGWGGFNLAEGLIDHQLLGLHHVRPDTPDWLAWDVGFLLSGAALVAVGLWLYCSRRANDAATIADPVT